MGKIRVKTIGDEVIEDKEAKATKKRTEARLAESKRAKKAEKSAEDSPEEVTEVKKDKKKTSQKQRTERSNNYKEKADLVDKNKIYSLSEALTLLEKINLSSFDETVELHINTTETGVSGSVVLPHGTGKETRIAIADGSDTKALDELIKAIESGAVNFDILIATPDAMPRLAKVARILGPKGLMPNPKNGTVTPKPQEVAKKYEGGQINFKTESKFPIIHIAVGKLSFGGKKLQENITSVFAQIPGNRIKNVTIKSTMSPGVKLDIATR